MVAWTRCNCEMLSTRSNFGSNGFLLRIIDIIFPKSRKREQKIFFNVGAELLFSSLCLWPLFFLPFQASLLLKYEKENQMKKVN